MLKNLFTFSRFTLLIALAISAIAAWYSVIGLTTIFAGAVIPIIVMGSILEVAKITTTVWLHRYWRKAPVIIKSYLTVAVIALACLTSMGVFGLLSKSHLEQSVATGDVGADVALYDEKIKTQRDNIEYARKALAQMDAQVDQRLTRGESEAGAERAVQIRRQQAAERGRLQGEIAAAQREIQTLNEQRAPIASKLRKVESEVGPVKYIAAMIYGDNPDSATLERAVRWVIILIVAVFDPLAIILILAANSSLAWEKEERNKPVEEAVEEDPKPVLEPTVVGEPLSETDGAIQEQPGEQLKLDIEPAPPVGDSLVAAGPGEVQNGGITQETEVSTISQDIVVVEPETATIRHDQPAQVASVGQPNVGSDRSQPVIETEGVTEQEHIYSLQDPYAIFEGKTISTSALRELYPKYVTSDPIVNDILWGRKFPAKAKTGDQYVRIDAIPHKLFKFVGGKWIELNKLHYTAYLHNTDYLAYLITKIDTGEYDTELLTPAEEDEISNYLKSST